MDLEWKTTTGARAKAERELGPVWFDRFMVIRESLRVGSEFTAAGDRLERLKEAAGKMDEAATAASATLAKRVENVAALCDNAQATALRETAATLSFWLGAVSEHAQNAARQARRQIARPMAAWRSGQDVDLAEFARVIFRALPDAPTSAPAWAAFAICSGLTPEPGSSAGDEDWRSIKETWRSVIKRGQAGAKIERECLPVASSPAPSSSTHAESRRQRKRVRRRADP